MANNSKLKIVFPVDLISAECDLVLIGDHIDEISATHFVKNVGVVGSSQVIGSVDHAYIKPAYLDNNTCDEDWDCWILLKEFEEESEKATICYIKYIK